MSQWHKNFITIFYLFFLLRFIYVFTDGLKQPFKYQEQIVREEGFWFPPKDPEGTLCVFTDKKRGN